MAETSFKQPNMTNYPRLWWRRAVRNWPFVIWLLILIVLAAFYSRNEQFGEMMGALETIEEPVAPMETARLLSVNVRPGQTVKAGDVVAQMDVALIDAEIAVSQAELIEAEETITGYQQNIVKLMSQFVADLTDAETVLRTALTDQQSDEAQLAALKTEIQRLEALLARRLVSERDVAGLRPEAAALEVKVAAHPKLVELASRRVRNAERELESMRKWLREAEGDDTTLAIQQKMQARNAIIAANREMLNRRKKAYTLQAARDGRVSSILLQPGDVVNAGTPIMVLVMERSDYIVGFLPEVHLTDLKVGDKVLAWRANGQGLAVYAKVESVSPDVQALPGRVSPIQGQVLRGRRVMLKIEGPHDFIPGESIEIHESHTGWLAIWDSLTLRTAGRSARTPGRAEQTATPGPTNSASAGGD